MFPWSSNMRSRCEGMGNLAGLYGVMGESHGWGAFCWFANGGYCVGGILVSPLCWGGLRGGLCVQGLWNEDLGFVETSIPWGVSPSRTGRPPLVMEV